MGQVAERMIHTYLCRATRFTTTVNLLSSHPTTRLHTHGLQTRQDAIGLRSRLGCDANQAAKVRIQSTRASCNTEKRHEPPRETKTETYEYFSIISLILFHTESIHCQYILTIFKSNNYLVNILYLCGH